jgi:hypothetical protein
LQVVKRPPVADKQPGRVVVIGVNVLGEVLYGVFRVLVTGQREGELTTRTLRRVATSRRWSVRQTGHNAMFVYCEPGPSSEFVSTT